jgi:hypothetical protein
MTGIYDNFLHKLRTKREGQLGYGLVVSRSKHFR